MLILTRRTNEVLVITVGTTVVTVTHLGNKGNQTRLGIKAPKEVLVDREEVTRRKAREELSHG